MKLSAVLISSYQKCMPLTWHIPDDPWLRWCLAIGFFTVTSFSTFPSFHTALFGSKLLNVAHPEKMNTCAPCGENIHINYLKFFCIICLLSPIFKCIQFGVFFLHQHRHIDMYFIVSVLITHYNFFYLVAQIVPTSAIERSFNWCFCPFALPPSFWFGFFDFFF